MKVASKNPPDTKFCFTRDIMLLSHTSKPNKIVLLASSYLRTTTIIDEKPTTILHYNITKGGTDYFDQLCHSYSVSRVTSRWPMRFFFGMLDQAIVNARILHKCKWMVHQQNQQKSLTAKECLDKIVFSLIEPYLRERYAQQCLRSNIKKGIAGILNIDTAIPITHEPTYLEQKQRCLLCTRQQDRKTRILCSSCERPMCYSHRMYMCYDCGSLE